MKTGAFFIFSCTVVDSSGRNFIIELCFQGREYGDLRHLPTTTVMGTICFSLHSRKNFLRVKIVRKEADSIVQDFHKDSYCSV